MAWKTGLAWGFTATRSSGRSTAKYSADMMVASEAEEAWWPPTFRPSAFGRMWLAWWMVQDDSHSTLRASAFKRSRRSDCGGHGVTRGRKPGYGNNSKPRPVPKCCR
jgi:hypothetical protein